MVHCGSAPEYEYIRKDPCAHWVHVTVAVQPVFDHVVEYAAQFAQL